MKQKNFSQSVNALEESQELNYEVEGYSTCSSAYVRCEEDCIGDTCMWSCAN